MITPAFRRSRLQASLTTLIDQSDEIAGTGAPLQRPHVRLLRLIGTGDVRRARLAERVTEELRAAFSNDVLCVHRSPIRDPKLVAQTVKVRHSDTLPFRWFGERMGCRAGYVSVAEQGRQLLVSPATVVIRVTTQHVARAR